MMIRALIVFICLAPLLSGCIVAGAVGTVVGVTGRVAGAAVGTVAEGIGRTVTRDGEPEMPEDPNAHK